MPRELPSFQVTWLAVWPPSPAIRPPTVPTPEVALVHSPAPLTWTDSVPPPLTATAPVAGIELVGPNCRTPALTFVPPLYVFTPVSSCTMLPTLVRLPVPVMAALYEASRAVLPTV